MPYGRAREQPSPATAPPAGGAGPARPAALDGRRTARPTRLGLHHPLSVLIRDLPWFDVESLLYEPPGELLSVAGARLLYK